MANIVGVNSNESPDGDYYAVLGIAEGEDATERQIKTAWRQLSKQHHPDVAGESQRETYQRIQRAYEILGDRRKRKVYDILGLDGLKQMEQPRQQQQNMHPFMHLFGGVSRDSHRGEDVDMLVVLSLADMYSGASHTLEFSKTKICRACRGTGARSQKDVINCPHCGGEGRVIRRVQLAPGFIQQMEQPCSHCGGRGKHIAAKCPVCAGAQVKRGPVTISVDVEQGLPEGEVLTYELEGDQQPHQVPGDLRLTVVSAPHDHFERKGNDLYVTVEITLKEALLGFHKRFQHIDGHEVDLAESGVTQHRFQVKVAGEGMPRYHVPSERGDLYITYEILLPTQLLTEQKEALAKIL